jgi:hypothetical protein
VIVDDEELNPLTDALNAIKAGTEYDPVEVAEVLINNQWFQAMEDTFAKAKKLYEHAARARADGEPDEHAEEQLAALLKRIRNLGVFA